MPILINGSQTFSKKGGFREGLQQKSKACFIFFHSGNFFKITLRVRNSEISSLKKVASF